MTCQGPKCRQCPHWRVARPICGKRETVATLQSNCPVLERCTVAVACFWPVSEPLAVWAPRCDRPCAARRSAPVGTLLQQAVVSPIAEQCEHSALMLQSRKRPPVRAPAAPCAASQILSRALEVQRCTYYSGAGVSPAGNALSATRQTCWLPERMNRQVYL